jgi:hypothetical protein
MEDAKANLGSDEKKKKLRKGDKGKQTFAGGHLRKERYAERTALCFCGNSGKEEEMLLLCVWMWKWRAISILNKQGKSMVEHAEKQRRRYGKGERTTTIF